MPNFLEDYSSINSAGSAVQGFIKGLDDYQDRQMKKTEFDAKMKSMQTSAEREALNQKIDMRAKHLAQGPDGTLTDAPMSGADRSDHLLKEATAGQMRTGEDPLGNATGYKVDPEQLKAKQMEAKAAAQASAAAMRTASNQNAQEIAKDRLDRADHNGVLRRLAQNSNIKARVSQYQNLDNALSTIVQADHVTPQQVMEFQQAVRSNLGIKGTSGIGEREETYFKTAGMNAAAWKQFMTGDPAELSKNSNLMNHFKQLASIEQGNIKKQFHNSLIAATGGHKSMYARREDLAGDLEDALTGQEGQLVSQNPAEPARGLVQPEQGFLGKAGGFLFGSPSQAASSPPSAHPEAAEAMSWAKNPKSPGWSQEKADEIIRRLGGQ